MCVCVLTENIVSTHHAQELVLAADNTEINQTQALPKALILLTALI